MDWLLIIWLAIMFVAWVLVVFLIWGILAGAERQTRKDRAKREAHPTTPSKEGENRE